MYNGLRNYNGFTLAEVLITLGIIGVVAALTIPSLMRDIQDAELKSAWKKSYSTVLQATARLRDDNGGTLTGVFDSFSSPYNQIRDIYAPYFNSTSSCDAFGTSGSTTAGKCWSSSATLLNGNSVVGDIANTLYNRPALNLSDGAVLAFFADGYTPATHCTSAQWCCIIYVDVNGLKKPNVIGRDIHRIGIYPTKTTLDTGGCSGNGYGCAADYLYK